MAIDARDLALGGAQDFLVDNACALNSLSFVPQQQLVPFGQEHVDVFLDFRNTASSPSLPGEGSSDTQSMEIDRLITFQNQRLALALQEQRKQQNAVLMKRMERKTLFLLKQREEETAKAASRTAELQDFLNRMEMESRTWQKAAKEKEATVASLNSTIERLKEAANLSWNRAGDAESWWQSERRDCDWKKRMICRWCDSRNSCMIMLPCGHLCSCSHCEAFLDFCPVCGTVKKATIQALI